MLPLEVKGDIFIGCFLNGSQVYNLIDRSLLVGYDLKVSETPGTFLSFKVVEVINKNHGYTGDPFIYLVVKPLHDDSGNCFPRREIWVQEGLNDLLPCGHVKGWCTCVGE